MRNNRARILYIWIAALTVASSVPTAFSRALDLGPEDRSRPLVTTRPTYEIIDSLPAILTDASRDANGGFYLPENRRSLLARQSEFLAGDGFCPAEQYTDGETIFFHADDFSLNENWRDYKVANYMRTILENERGNDDFQMVVLYTPDSDHDAEELKRIPAYREALKSGRLKLVSWEHFLRIWVRDYSPVVLRSLTDNTLKLVSVLHGNAIWASNEEERRKYVQTSRAMTALQAEILGDGAIVEEHHDFFLEPGNLLTDGRCSCFTTTATVQWNMENPVEQTADGRKFRGFTDEDKAHVANRMQAIFGCRRVLFLESELGGVSHIDVMLVPTAHDSVVLSMTAPVRKRFQDNSIEEVFNEIEEANLAALLEAGYVVHRTPNSSPGYTFANVLITGHSVYVPTYRDDGPVKLSYGQEIQESLNDIAVKTFSKLFPRRRIVPFNEVPRATSGSIHCRTSELPCG